MTDLTPGLPWSLEPFEGESISHYLGRLRRLPEMSVSTPGELSSAAGIGSAVSRWEKFRFNPHPTYRQLKEIAKLISVEVEKLQNLCPPPGEKMVYRSTRLCAACYCEAPYHRLYWQFQSTEVCQKHQLPLISRCPACDLKFPQPFEWIEGKCQRCGMKYTSMKKQQKKAQAKREAKTNKPTN